MTEGTSPESAGKSIDLWDLSMFLGSLLIVLAVVVPNFIRARTSGSPGACKSNLKNLGTAMEMYSTDNNGKYPTGSNAFLTPNYLKTIPECPAAGTDTYRLTSGPGITYNTQGYQDYYFIICEGANHLSVSVPPNYPQYNGVVGLIER